MARDVTIIDRTLSAQAAMFRLAERDYGLTAKRLALDTGIPHDTLRTKIRGCVLLTIAEFNRLAAAGLPDELLSLVTEPGGKDVVTPIDDGDDGGRIVKAAARLVAETVEANTPIERQDAMRSARVFAAGLRPALRRAA